MFLCIFLIALLTVVYFWVQKRFQYWTDIGFPQGTPSFPMGTLKGTGTKMSMAENLDQFYRQFKGKSPAIGLYNFLSPALLAIDPELIKNILVRDFQTFDRGFYHNKEYDPVSVNMYTLNGQEWKDRRAKFTPLFTLGKTKMMFEIVEEISNKFVEVIEKESSKCINLEMRGWLQRLTIDNIANTAFGINPNCVEEENTAFEYYGKRIFNINFARRLKLIFSTSWPDLARKFHMSLIDADVSDFFFKTFKDALEYREKSKINRNDFMQLLLGLKDTYTTEELAAEAVSIFSGGYETSSTLMTFVLYELALNSDIQDRLREEITSALAENDDMMTYDLLFSLKYLDMVVNESLRKYPPIPNIFRKANENYRIPNTKLVIPKGTVVFLNSFSTQRDPEYFPEPMKFDPERFNEENVRNIKPFTNIPFTEGPRNCLGKTFGLMQSKLGIVKIIKNFEVSICEKTPIPMTFDMNSVVLAPPDGMWLNLKRIG